MQFGSMSDTTLLLQQELQRQLPLSYPFNHYLKFESCCVTLKEEFSQICNAFYKCSAAFRLQESPKELEDNDSTLHH